MRLPCLHGRGTSSDILETQLSPLRSLLTTQAEFDFADAQFEGPPAPGIERVFEPPYFEWYRCPSPSNVSKVHDYIKALVDEEGPYDGVIGFSEGASLAAALLLEGASNGDKYSIPMFRFAVFFNAVNLFSPSTGLGERMLESDFLSAMDTFTQGKSINQYPDLDCVYALRANTVPGLIRVPTLHVIGLNDAFRTRSEELVKLCEGRSAVVVRSTAAHEMPRGRSLAEVARRLDRMIATELMAS